MSIDISWEYCWINKVTLYSKLSYTSGIIYVDQKYSKNRVFRTQHQMLVRYGTIGTFINCWMQNGTASLEDSLATSYKTKYTLTLPSNCCAPWYLHQRHENLWPYKNLHMNIYSSFIHNHQNLEANKMSFQTVEYYSALKRHELSSHEKTSGNLNAYY